MTLLLVVVSLSATVSGGEDHDVCGPALHNTTRNASTERARRANRNENEWKLSQNKTAVAAAGSGSVQRVNVLIPAFGSADWP